MRITDFDTFDENGNEISADTHGNNIAFNCFECNHTILAVALENQKGFDDHHPANCKDAKVIYSQLEFMRLTRRSHFFAA